MKTIFFTTMLILSFNSFSQVTLEKAKEFMKKRCLDINMEYVVEKYDRLLQICAPGLVPIVVEVVNSIEELGSQTERGAGGFGSTGR